MKMLKMREMENFFEDHGPPLTLIFTALHVISLTILVLEIYRKDHRKFPLPWTALLVFYPIYLLYEIPRSLPHLSFLLSENCIFPVFVKFSLIATKLLGMICLVLIWIAAFLYRKKQKEHDFAESHMVVCSGKNFYKNQAENHRVDIESDNV